MRPYGSDGARATIGEREANDRLIEVAGDVPRGALGLTRRGPAEVSVRPSTSCRPIACREAYPPGPGSPMGRRCAGQPARSDSATTRRACAAIVSAGFIAADDGKKPPSTTHRLSRSCALQWPSSTLVRRVHARDDGAAHVAVHADVEGLGEHHVVARVAHQPLGPGEQPGVLAGVRGHPRGPDPAARARGSPGSRGRAGPRP